jgi:2-amino-4-hydroxy-6-hydroxymethyldihydropteridine diphosphokinase
MAAIIGKLRDVDIMAYVLLALGSNLATPTRQLTSALKAIAALPKTTVLQVAPLFRNSAWGKKTVPDFYNTVVWIKTELKPMNLLKHCQRIEVQHGRVRRAVHQARTLDVDVLNISNYTSVHPRLTLPHPRMHERSFVLHPCKQLKVHPKLIFMT